ncbi:thioesterase II family protein [Actinophytocola sediminis]
MDLWLRRYDRRPDAEHVVVCFPHAGGPATQFRALSAALPASVELFSAQYPGRQDRLREPLIDDVVTLAERLAPLVAGLGNRPLALFGHSLGGSVAFEVARRLAGGSPVALFVSARRPPSSPSVKRNHLATDADLIRIVKALGGPGSMLLDDPDFAEMALPVIRSDYRAAELYQCAPAAVVDAPVVAVVGDADPEVDADLARGWAAHTSGEFTLKVLAGNHFYLDQHIPTLAGMLTDQLVAAKA